MDNSRDMNNFENFVFYSSETLLKEQELLILPSLSSVYAIEIGDMAKSIGDEKSLPIAVEVRLDTWTVYHVSLSGSTPENDWWIG